jgi:hypothetical protein
MFQKHHTSASFTMKSENIFQLTKFKTAMAFFQTDLLTMENPKHPLA